MLDKTLGYILCCQSPGLFLAAAVLVIAYFAGRKKHRFKATLKLLLGIVCAVGGVVLYYMGMYDEYFPIRDFFRIRPAGWVGFGIVAFLTLLALVQTAQGTAADFLRRKRVTSTALAEHTAAHAAGRPRRLHSRDLAPELSKAMEFAVLGAHAASAARAENEHLLCAILEDSSCTASRWLAALGIERPRGNAASFPVSLCCPPSRGWLPPARAAPAINMAAT